jgi:hypothetical protein
VKFNETPAAQGLIDGNVPVARDPIEVSPPVLLEQLVCCGLLTFEKYPPLQIPENQSMVSATPSCRFQNT